MLFKGKLTEFATFWEKFKIPRLVVFKFFDAISEKIYLQKIKSIIDAEIVTGDTLTASQLEDFLQQSSPFFKKSMIVLNAHQLSLNAVNACKLSNDKTIILFTSKDIPSLKEYSIVIEEFPFYEKRYLWSFFVRELGIKLTQDVFNYLVESVNADSRTIFNTLTSIQNSYQEELITLDKVKNLVEVQKQDLFYISRLLGKKDFKQVFSKLIEFPRVETFTFLASFISKLAYSNGPITNKYQREIAGFSRNWSKTELNYFSNLFTNLIILGRENPTLLNLKLLELESVYLSG